MKMNSGMGASVLVLSVRRVYSVARHLSDKFSGGRVSLRSHRVVEHLRGLIADGRLVPGERLPPEPVLADRLGVSRGTLREAMRTLAEEGYVRRSPGAGTHVMRRPAMRNTLERNFGVSHLIEAFGLEAGTSERECVLEPAGDELADALAIDPDDEVLALRRVRTANGDPVVYSIDHCPAALLPGVDPEQFGAGSVYETLRDAGIEVHHGAARLRPWSADAFLADRLRTARGALLLEIWQVDYTGDDRPVLASREFHLADAFDISVYRRGPGIWEG
jgi:GntR family transcriptional regulator